MKRTVLSIVLGLVLTAAVYPVIVYARGCYAPLLAVDPETGEPVNCYLISEDHPCRYQCPWGVVEP